MDVVTVKSNVADHLADLYIVIIGKYQEEDTVSHSYKSSSYYKAILFLVTETTHLLQSFLGQGFYTY